MPRANRDRIMRARTEGIGWPFSLFQSSAHENHASLITQSSSQGALLV